MRVVFQTGLQLARAIEGATPGSRILYHEGFLACDIVSDKRVADVAGMARRLSVSSMPLNANDISVQYGQGVGTLLQRRVSDGWYEYHFRKNNRPG
jgi:hypothetical protein